MIRVEQLARARERWRESNEPVLVGSRLLTRLVSTWDQGAIGIEHAGKVQPISDEVAALCLLLAEIKPLRITCPACRGNRERACLNCITKDRTIAGMPWDVMLLDARAGIRRRQAPVQAEQSAAELDAEAMAIESLHTLADRLLGQGDPLGEALALWLAELPCSTCKGSRYHPCLAGVRYEGFYEEVRATIDVIDPPTIPQIDERIIVNGWAWRVEWLSQRTSASRRTATDLLSAIDITRAIDGKILRRVKIRAMRSGRATDGVGVSFDCPACAGSGLECTAKLRDIVEPLTWIRDRLPLVGDEIELNVDPSTVHDDQIGDLRRLGRVAAVKTRVLLENEAALIQYWADIPAGGWRYRVHSTGAEAPADH